MTDRLPQPNYEKIPNKKNLSFQNNSLPEVKVPPGSKKKKESRNGPKERDGSLEINYEKSADRDSAIVKARNVVSLQPSNRNEEIEVLKKKLKIENENNIRVIKPTDLDSSNNNEAKSKERDEKGRDFLLPNIKGGSNNGNGSYDNKQENSPRRK